MGTSVSAMVTPVTFLVTSIREKTAKKYSQGKKHFFDPTRKALRVLFRSVASNLPGPGGAA